MLLCRLRREEVGILNQLLRVCDLKACLVRLKSKHLTSELEAELQPSRS